MRYVFRSSEFKVKGRHLFLWVVLLLFAFAPTASSQYSEIWGTTLIGGDHNAGYLFKMDPDGSNLQVMHHFTDGAGGKNPNGALAEGPDGRLYGMTFFGGDNDFGIIYAYDRFSESFSIEYHLEFSIGHVLTLAPNGKFYTMSSNNQGSLYSYDPISRTLSLEYDFTPEEGRDAFAEGNLVPDGTGKLYGTTFNGGLYDDGVLFEYDIETRTWRVLHHFGLSSRQPTMYLILHEGNLFGTTIWGGENGRGLLFEYNLSTGIYSERANFSKDVSTQAKGVCVGPDGNLYLHSQTGGTQGQGGILRFDPDTHALDNVHSFATSGPYIPTGSMMQTWEGRLFGVTRLGGSGMGLGTIYEYHPSTENIAVRQSLNNGYPGETRLLQVGERTVTSVAIEAPSTAIEQDDGTLQLTASLTPVEAADQPVLWSVDDPDLAMIDEAGRLIAKGNGTVSVTATANYGLGASQSITITITGQDGLPGQIDPEFRFDGDIVEFTHKRFGPNGPAPITYEVSTDLIQWDPLVENSDYQIESIIDNGDGTENVTLSLTDRKEGRLFLRMATE